MQPNRNKSRATLAALLTGSAICGLAVAPQALHAQAVDQTVDQTVNQTAPEGVIVLDEITLYGDRTTSSIDETTASVAVVGQGALSQPTVQSYTDAYRQMANVSTGDWTESGFIIRGVNSEGLTPGGLGVPLASF